MFVPKVLSSSLPAHSGSFSLSVHTQVQKKGIEEGENGLTEKDYKSAVSGNACRRNSPAPKL